MVDGDCKFGVEDEWTQSRREMTRVWDKQIPELSDMFDKDNDQPRINNRVTKEGDP